MVAVLGIDPSLAKTGLVLANGPALMTRRVVTEPTHSSIRARLMRQRSIVAQVRDFAPTEGRVLTVIEAPVIAVGGAGGGLFDRAGLYWRLIDELWAYGPVVTVQPATRALYAAGNGQASKKDVLASMRARVPISIVDDNVADAMALAAMGRRYLGDPIDGHISDASLRAMRTPHWPDEGLRLFQEIDFEEVNDGD